MAKTILAIDDEVAVRNLFEYALRIEGYDVRLAGGAETAFKILKEEVIEATSLGLKLFGMDGTELCKQIRKDSPIAIIFAMTG